MRKTRSETATEIEISFIAGMEQLVATMMEGGIEAVKAKHGLPIPPAPPFELPVIGRRDVVAARRSLGVSPSDFAKILGVSAQSVRAGESGEKPPPGVARRLIGEIRDKPDNWRERFQLQAAASA